MQKSSPIDFIPDSSLFFLADIAYRPPLQSHLTYWKITRPKMPPKAWSINLKAYGFIHKPCGDFLDIFDTHIPTLWTILFNKAYVT